MRREFIIERQGKTFCLYAGLLDLAHENGLSSIVTTLVQVPSKENGDTAIATATVQMEDDRVFTGIGDASPKNVAPMMQAHIIRMAETRAKSRALRDAVNIGVAAFEELGPDNSGSGEESNYVETERPPARNFAQEFKERAQRMGYEGKMSPLCVAILGLTSTEHVTLTSYTEAMKKSAAEWNRAIDGLKADVG